jgi:type II secretory pathway pseudopilin PulG
MIKKNIGGKFMSKIKKIKKIISLIVTIIVIAGIVIAISMYSQWQELKREEDRQLYIQSLIDAEIAAKDNIDKPTTKPDDSTDSKPGGDVSLDDIISGSIEDSKVENVFSNIEMINSSTFKATINGEERTYRLIGVANDGNKDAVKQVLESLTAIVITQDSAKEKDGATLIYLWEGNDDTIANMVNLQIVRNGFCKTTYSQANHGETPNVKYSTQFISAYKDSKK